ncbi:MAG: hypothetical protein HFJ07_03145 [Lachnospiraceae bacterium]|nr:hypothetical protein [Lachnospiraceae bacterium]MCX4377923.1 hypothetical protein [Lachnospiraceae bacterium]
MKIWKLLSGILCIICSSRILLLSCVAGLVSPMGADEAVQVEFSIAAAVLILIGGIVSIAVRNKNAGNAVVAMIFAIEAIVIYILSGKFEHLMIWATWALICSIIFVAALLKDDKPQ